MSTSSSITEGLSFLGTVNDFIGDAGHTANNLFATLGNAAVLYRTMFPDDPKKPRRAVEPADAPEPRAIPWGTLVLVGAGMLAALLLIMAFKG